MNTLILRLTLLSLAMAQDAVDSFEAAARRNDDRIFNAFWIPIAVVMAGAAAMTIWCTSRGYKGFRFELTWRGFRAGCYK